MNRRSVSKQRGRIAWFVDLEVLAEHLEWLPELRDQVGLTTVVPESHISHTSGFRASPRGAGPLDDWRSRPTLRDHRQVFGVPEPAMAVLPGIVGGVDDTPLLAVIEVCRREGLEVWGHAWVWCYGGEVFPEFAAVDLSGQPLTPGSLPWGTMFCPNQPEVHAFIVHSLADAAANYDLDGWFLDHARYPSPGHSASLLGCGCARCASVAEAKGVDFDACRADFERLAADFLAHVDLQTLRRYAAGGPAGLQEFVSGYPGVEAWFEARATMLADRLAEIGQAIQSASGRAVEFGSDVFPPSVALLGGQRYAEWTRTATYLTGGFGARIGWSTVTRVTADGLARSLVERMPWLAIDEATAAIMALLGASGPDEAPLAAFARELHALAASNSGVPVYPPIPAGQSPDALRTLCRTIVAEGLDGAMLAGLEQYDADQRMIVRKELAARLD